MLRERQTLSFFHDWIADPDTSKVPDKTGLWDRVFRSFIQLQKKQKISEAALNRTLDRFEKGAKALPDAVIFLDNTNRILWCNPKAEEYFQLRLSRDKGFQIDYLIRQTAFRTFLKKEASSEPSTIQLAGGRVQRYVSLQIVSFGQNQKLLLAQDVTDREKLDTTRRDFIANVSHELRTPLTVIQGYLETFEEDPTEDPELLARGIELMSDQSRRMNRLVEDLLTLSRLETSDALQDETINVSSMLSAISHEAEALSKSNHRVHLDIEDGLDLIGAQDEIRSAFTNLVSNAIRYSPNGGDINLRWYSSSDTAIFSCKDQGVGIDTQHIDRLTERFYRVDKSRSRETGGTGLGLAIVKHVLNRHGATLNISSVPGEGSMFSAIFPKSRTKKY